jgi:RNase H-fold protein (predicted Holliday junction resolvase)
MERKMKKEEEYRVYFEDGRKTTVYAKSVGHAKDIARKQGFSDVYDATRVQKEL